MNPYDPMPDKFSQYRRLMQAEAAIETLKAALVELSSKLHELQDKERANG